MTNIYPSLLPKMMSSKNVCYLFLLVLVICFMDEISAGKGGGHKIIVSTSSGKKKCECHKKIVPVPVPVPVHHEMHGHGHGHGGGGERRMDMSAMIPSYASQYYNSYAANPYGAANTYADPYGHAAAAYGAAGYGSSFGNFGQFLWRKKRSLLDAIYSTFQKKKQ